MKTTIIIAFVIITLLTEGRVAQQYECVEFDLEQLAKPCSIYNPSSLAYLDTSSQTLEEALTEMNSYITGIVAYGSVFQECAPWSTWYCQNPSLTDGKPPPLRSCGVDDNGQAPPTPTPIPTCRTMCEGFLKACRASYQAMGPAFGSLVPKSFCNSFSNDGVMVDGVHIPCWNVTPTYTPPTGNITCPEYTRKSPDGHCQPQCPSPEYTKDQVFHLGLMQQIVGWISFVVALILSVFFVVRKELRSFPTRMILFLLLGSMGLSLAFMLATFVGGNVGDVWCGDHDSYSAVKLNADDRSINDEGLCVFQGWNIILGTLLLSFWWAALSFNTALIIHAGLDYALFETQKHVLEATYHVVCWGVPLALSVVAAAATKIDYEPSYAFCFISSSNNAAWQIGLWFVPVGLCLLVGLLCSLYSVLKIIGSQSAKLNPTYLAVTIRILCCVLFFFTVIVIIFTYVIFAAVQENNNAIALVLYLICLLSGTIEESVCRETQLNQAQPFQTQYGLAAAATFFMAAAGVFLSLFFGTSDKVIRALRSTSSQDMPVSSFSSNNLDRDQS